MHLGEEDEFISKTAQAEIKAAQLIASGQERSEAGPLARGARRALSDLDR
jgi:hypothetical protein